MADLEDLFKGLDRFVGGVRELQIGRALNSANEQVQQIRSTETDVAQKQNALRDVANQLTMNLTQLGTPASQIENVASTIAPKPPTIQTNEQGLAYAQTAGDQNLVDFFQKQIKSERDFQLQKAKEGATLRTDNSLNKERRARLSKTQDAFTRFGKDFTKAKAQAQNAIKLLDSNNPITAGAVKVLILRASGEVGNSTEAEKEPFAGRQDLVSKMKRWANLSATSQLPEGDKEALKEIAKMYLEVGDKAQVNFGEDLAGQLGVTEYYQGTPQEDLYKLVTGKSHPGGLNPQQPQEAQAQPAGGLGQPGSLKSLLIPRGGVGGRR